MKKIKIKENERGLLFNDEQFQNIADAGRYTVWPLSKTRYEVYSIEDSEFKHKDLEHIHRINPQQELKTIKVHEGEVALVTINGHIQEFYSAGVYAFWAILHEVKHEIFKIGKGFSHAELEKMYQEKERFPELEFLDISDSQQALVHINGKIQALYSRGLYAFWKKNNEISVTNFESNEAFFEHKQIKDILKHHSSAALLSSTIVPSGFKALSYIDGKFNKVHEAGLYAWWKDAGQVLVRTVDMREQSLEINGQDIMTADKVTLRINALISFKIADIIQAVEGFEDFSDILYREVQLILRSMIGQRQLDNILQDKEELALEVRRRLDTLAQKMGLDLHSFGVKDIILPGEMKDLLNKVTEAKKAAEASLITRREETASMRSQANTAKIMENNPALLKLREMEILEKLSANSNLQISLGDNTLSEQLKKLA